MEWGGEHRLESGKDKIEWKQPNKRRANYGAARTRTILLILFHFYSLSPSFPFPHCLGSADCIQIMMAMRLATIGSQR